MAGNKASRNAPGGSADRAARERTRVYQARQQLHADGIARRRRDNIIAAIAGAVLLIGVLGAQTLYFTAGPGVPTPTPTATVPAVPTDPVPTESSTPEPSPASPPASPPATPTPVP